MTRSILRDPRWREFAILEAQVYHAVMAHSTWRISYNNDAAAQALSFKFKFLVKLPSSSSLY